MELLTETADQKKVIGLSQFVFNIPVVLFVAGSLHYLNRIFSPLEMLRVELTKKDEELVRAG